MALLIGETMQRAYFRRHMNFNPGADQASLALVSIRFTMSSPNEVFFIAFVRVIDD